MIVGAVSVQGEEWKRKDAVFRGMSATAIPSAAGVRHTQLGEIVLMQRKMVLQAETCTNRIPYKVPEEPSQLKMKRRAMLTAVPTPVDSGGKLQGVEERVDDGFELIQHKVLK